MEFDQLRKYPEWKELLDKIRPLIDGGKKEFSYDELEALAGIDIRQWKGRGQFYRFRKQALKEWQVWFECVAKFGYVIIPAGDHPKASLKRVQGAREKITMARAINELVKIEEMTPAQIALQAQTAVLLHDLSQTFNRVGRQFRAAASKLHLEISEDDVRRIADKEKPKEAKKLPPAED